MGVGRFSEFGAKSATVNSCCRSFAPNTNTGSLPAVKFSANMMRGSIGARASRTPANAALVSASAALCMGLLARVILAASANVNGVASCATTAMASPIIATKTRINWTDPSLGRFTSEVFVESRMSASQPLRADRSRLFHRNDLVGGFNLCA